MSRSSFLPDDFSGAIPRRTTFFTANIIACLQSISPEHTDDIQNAGIRFLLSQKSAWWSFNYWAQDAAERTTLPYPDDLDDTFAALAAIVWHNGAAIDAHAFSAIAKLLTACEVEAGGPYRTWLVAGTAAGSSAHTTPIPTVTPAWRDIDPVVNATIGHFLSLVGVRLPPLERFLADAVRSRQMASPYYPGTIHTIYFLSRFYKNRGDADTRAMLAESIVASLDRDDHNEDVRGSALTTLECAMAITSLINLGDVRCETIMPIAIDTLISKIEQEGFLPYAFCIDPARHGRRCYAGASALTAAFCAEALASARNTCTRPDGHAGDPPTAATPHTAITIHDHVRAVARGACRPLGDDLRAMAIAQIKRTHDEKITALAYEFYDALRKKGIFIPPDVVESLSLANLFGWMAYDIYDDALDGEASASGASLIPCANFFLRAAADIYRSIGARDPRIVMLFASIMDRVDSANAWEQYHCHTIADLLPAFGDHHTLADRSIGHAAGPLAMLILAGYRTTSREYKSVAAFFHHYLIARQLHDDAHDWTDDLLHGRVNSIGAIVLGRHKKRYSDTALPALKKIFWMEVVDVAVRMIVAHVAAARRARERSPLADTDFMEGELWRLTTSARRAVTERDTALVFINDYKDPPPYGAAHKK